MIRKIMFIIIETQIDIAIAVNQLSQYLNKSHEIYLQAAKHLLCYLRDKIDLKILYNVNKENLIIFIDAVYANVCKFKLITEFLALISNDFII